MNLILIHIGAVVPAHLIVCLRQLAHVLPGSVRVHVVAKRFGVDVLRSCFDQRCFEAVAIEDIQPTEHLRWFRRTSRLDRRFRGGFWHAASERFLLLHAYAAEQGLRDVFHIEYDNLIYQDFTPLLSAFASRPMWAVFDNPDRCIPSFLYFQDSNVLERLAGTITAGARRRRNDMQTLADHRRSHPADVGLLPILDDARYRAHHPPIDPAYTVHFPAFGMLFDGAAVGQYIGGVDPRNTPGDTRGFVNETSVVKCDRLPLEWREHRPFLCGIPLVNLHIHSKDLTRWASFLP